MPVQALCVVLAQWLNAADLAGFFGLALVRFPSMPEAWAFLRGQARLVAPTWRRLAPNHARVGFFATDQKTMRACKKICVFDFLVQNI